MVPEIHGKMVAVVSCGVRGRRWPAAAFCVAGAVHRVSWRSCGARGRRWPAVAFCVAGAVHRASWTSCGARGRCWGRGCLSCGRRSTQSLLAELRRAWAPLARGSSQLITYQLITAALLTPHSSQLPCPSELITAPLLTGPLLITTYHIPTHHSSTSHTSLLTPHLSHHNFSSQLITTHHNSSQLITTHHNLSHPNSSQLHFSHHFSHLTYHIRTHHSSTSHT